MAGFGQAASARRRMALVLAYAVVLACAVAASAKTTHASAHTTVDRPSPGTTTELVITATYPVAEWLVRCDGIPVAGAGSEREWRATSDLAVGRHELMVDAQPVDMAATDPVAIRVRWRCATASDATVWGSGAVSTTVAIDVRCQP
jgi:hypothetical protein